MKETSGAWKTPIIQDDWEDVVPKAGWDEPAEVMSHYGTALVIPGVPKRYVHYVDVNKEYELQEKKERFARSMGMACLSEGEVLAEDATVDMAFWNPNTCEELELTVHKGRMLGATQYELAKELSDALEVRFPSRTGRVEQLPEALSHVSFSPDNLKMWKRKDKDD